MRGPRSPGTAGRALPRAAGIPSLGGIFHCREALQGERALPWGLQHPGLVGVAAHSRGIGIVIFNAMFRRKGEFGGKAASSSELETQALSLPQCRSFLPLTWRAPGARTAPPCFGAFAACAKQELQRVQHNFQQPHHSQGFWKYVLSQRMSPWGDMNFSEASCK